MTQFERGGMALGRWAPDLSETERDGTAMDDPSLQDPEEGDRLAQLPAHEIDQDDSLGGGVTAVGGTASEADADSYGEQPVPGEDANRESPDIGGLPSGDLTDER